MIDAARIDRRRPLLLHAALEAPRTWAAFAQLSALAPVMMRVPRGDGHAVLVLPGFLASDLSTVPLRSILQRLGYRTHGWRLGRNIGATNAVIDGLGRAVAELSRSESGSLSIVGWSLGGVFGRRLACKFPRIIRQVITLGSPFNSVDTVGFGATPGPLPVPSTAIYTRSDGIVHWRTTVQAIDHRSENVEVRGSHCGLGVNAAAVFAVADRLAQPEGAWAPFRPPLAIRRWYPRPWAGPEAEEPVDAARDAEVEEPAWTA